MTDYMLDPEKIRIYYNDNKTKKKCKKCNIFKSFESFTKDKNTWDSYKNNCKLCVNKFN